MIELYGVVSSRAFRSLWALEEVGVPYRLVSVDFKVGAKQAEYLALNPNGRVPCLKDGDLVLFESLAINLYLARRYGGSLMPQGIEDEARVLQWTLWATNEIEPHLSLINRHRVHLSEAERDPALIAAAEAALRAPLAVLGDALADRTFLLGADFTFADLNVAAVLATSFTARFDLSPFETVNRWFGTCMSRPAVQRALGR